MGEDVKVVEEVTEGVVNGNLIKVAGIILGVGAVIGIGYGIKKLIDKRKEAKLLNYQKQEQLPNSESE